MPACRPLLVGLYQLDHLRTPDHAAVAATVDATASLRAPWARRLVNGVLRRYLRERGCVLAHQQGRRGGEHRAPAVARRCPGRGLARRLAAGGARRQSPPADDPPGQPGAHLEVEKSMVGLMPLDCGLHRPGTSPHRPMLARRWR